MLRNKFDKTLFLVIVILLSIIIVKPMFESREGYAAKRIEYKVIPGPSSHEIVRRGADIVYKEFENGINKYGAEGWELVAYDDGWAFLIRR